MESRAKVLYAVVAVVCGEVESPVVSGVQRRCKDDEGEVEDLIDRANVN